MFKKGMCISLCVVGILSMACLAYAGDLMIWSPRTPAGGGSPGFIGSYLSQAAVVEYGPAASVGRDIDKPTSHQDSYYETENSSIQKYYSNDDGTLILYQQNESKQTTVQKQEAVIYYPTE